MSSQIFSPDIPKTAEEIEPEDIIRQLADRLEQAREGGAEHRMILRQMNGIRHDSELGSLLIEEYDIGAINYW
ncbi:hypothetical protein [Bradyrhizobium liaoningense]|uniref:hypothetical protein n=1 Tax=Bradyrhizobium liaoningense TaxID=43992 RepID=UPI001BAE4275|nr:hypothetical protein [Bradyrhizobium liaoningense]MBR0719212.1 hypothetical protein [Bradyrhizobium liaoningense]